ncbi:MAG: BON domain-containing protein [Terriglobales bacterium]
MTAVALLFAVFLAPQAAATPAHHHVKAKNHAAAAATKAPAAPKTAAEMQDELDSTLRAGIFAPDQIKAAVEGADITLHGTVHSAERKGLATRDARELAEKVGWHGFHVYNKIDVELPPLNAGH